ncbi:MAG: tetratricopeptide repeat protein [Candidatus Symbiothrix sp.]|jgi:tetratricopeptide (TPR) repeat protein|nr:tetratricopeptide repeat protein [Candidatus Symbiothrix sp.]
MTKIIYVLIAALFYSFSALSQETKENINDYIAKYQFRKAIAAIERLNDPDKELIRQKARCYSYLSNYHKAIETLAPLLEEYPDDTELKMQLALCYKDASMPEKSIEQFDELIVLDSANAYFIVQKADLLLQLNQPDSAETGYARAWEIDSTDYPTAVKLIKLNINQQKYQPALQHTEAIIAKDSSNMQINLLNAYCFYGLENYFEAINRFEKCHALGDTSLLLNKSLGISYFCEQNYDNAYPYLSQAYRQDTANNSVLYALAAVCGKTENYEESIQLFEKLINRTLPPKNTMYLYYKGLADAYDDNENYPQAIENYQQALNYASPFQSINVLFKLSDVSDIDLKDYVTAFGYYKQYRESLADYRQTLIMEDSLVNPLEIKSVDHKLDRLDEHIKYIEGLVNKQNKIK